MKNAQLNIHAFTSSLMIKYVSIFSWTESKLTLENFIKHSHYKDSPYIKVLEFLMYRPRQF